MLKCWLTQAGVPSFYHPLDKFLFSHPGALLTNISWTVILWPCVSKGLWCRRVWDTGGNRVLVVSPSTTFWVLHSEWNIPNFQFSQPVAARAHYVGKTLISFNLIIKITYQRNKKGCTRPQKCPIDNNCEPFNHILNN